MAAWPIGVVLPDAFSKLRVNVCVFVIVYVNGSNLEASDG